MTDIIECPHCGEASHIGGLIGPTTDDCPKCGRRALYNVAQLLKEAEKLREALYLALPYVEDHEESEIYKAGAVSWAVATIRAALGEPAA